MAVYRFCFASGHLTERLVQDRNLQEIECPACSEPATRESVYHFGIGGQAPPRYRLTEFQEAAQEANYYHGRMEESKGETIPRIDVVAGAKAKARQQGAKVK